MYGITNSVQGEFMQAVASGKPVFVLDAERCCIMSGCAERLAVGECLDDFIPPSHDSGLCESTMYRLGQMYCVRYMPFGGGYVGEILGSNDISYLMQFTDGMRSNAAYYSSIEYELSVIWENKHIIEKLLSKSDVAMQHIHRIEKSLYRMNAGSKNACEYMNVMYSAHKNTAVDIAKLCNELAARCNRELLEIGRHVEFRADDSEKLYIRSDSRCALAAMLNLVQNSLLYSPKECNPAFSIRSNGEQVHICIENQNALFGTEAESAVGFRGGYGIPIVRRFVSLADGVLTCNLEQAKAAVHITIPLVAVEEIADFVLEDVRLYEYATGVPDYIQLQMMQVVDMYSE